MHRTLLNYLELLLYTDKVGNLAMVTACPVDAINSTHVHAHIHTL